MRNAVSLIALAASLVLVQAGAASAARPPAPAPPPPPPTPKLVLAGAKGTTNVLIDMATRRTVRGQVEADGLLVFPSPPPEAAESPPQPASDGGEPEGGVEIAPDHGRITLRFDCKGRTINLIRDTLMSADNTVLKADLLPVNPQAPVDPTDAHLLALACGEAFPEGDKIFDSEDAAIAGVRNPA